MNISMVSSVMVPEGDGITVKRLMPVEQLRNFDPFVLWDHFDIEAGGFPEHPHRGFEAITYLFRGGMRHTDNLGNRGTIYAGGAQRFTAGRGILHSEFPDGQAAGIQLWINLPKRLKNIPPEYQQLEADMISETAADGVTIRVIAGEEGAINLHSAVEYLDIRLKAGSELRRSVAANWRGLVYIIEGEALVNLHSASAGEALLIEDTVTVHIASGEGAHLMWCFGKPHHEPIFQHGPFVD